MRNKTIISFKQILKNIFYKLFQSSIYVSNSKTRIIDSAKYLYDKKSNKKSVIIWTTQKTASTFIQKALKLISSNSEYTYYDYASCIWSLGNLIKLKNPFVIESECQFLYKEYGEIYGPIRKPFNLKNQSKFINIFFLRDPRDLLVSSFYSRSASHEIPKNYFWKQKFLQDRKKSLELGIDKYCLEYADNWIIPDFKNYQEMMEKNSKNNYFLSYDYFINSPSDFIRSLSEIMNIELSENLIRKLKSKALDPFKNKIFKKSKVTHYRSGKNRQFEKELKEETLIQLNDKLRKILEYWNFAI